MGRGEKHQQGQLLYGPRAPRPSADVERRRQARHAREDNAMREVLSERYRQAQTALIDAHDFAPLEALLAAPSGHEELERELLVQTIELLKSQNEQLARGEREGGQSEQELRSYLALLRHGRERGLGDEALASLTQIVQDGAARAALDRVLAPLSGEPVALPRLTWSRDEDGVTGPHLLNAADRPLCGARPHPSELPWATLAPRLICLGCLAHAGEATRAPATALDADQQRERVWTSHRRRLRRELQARYDGRPLADDTWEAVLAHADEAVRTRLQHDLRSAGCPDLARWFETAEISVAPQQAT